MISTVEEIESIFQMKDIFFSPLHCHICCLLIEPGDHILTANAIETYARRYNFRRDAFRTQWHVKCLEECYEQ